MKNDENLKVVRLTETSASLDEILDEFVQKAESQWGGSLAEMVKPLKKAVSEKKVDGWVICSQDHPVGVAISTYSDERGRINFMHVLSRHQDEGLYPLLIEHTVSELRKAGATRINSEVMVLGDEEAVSETFKKLGFRLLKRKMMCASLADDVSEPPLPQGCTVVSWDDTCMEAVATLIWDANQGGVDQLIYPEFETRESVSRMVQGIRRGTSGHFDEKVSLVALCEGSPCAVVLFTRSSPDEGFIAEMAVGRNYQGRGVGKALLARSLSCARAQGIKKVRLGVTEENISAVNLYKGLGFTPELQLSAYVWKDPHR